MKKFANDLLEVGKDIVQGLSFCAEVYCNFWQHTVWFAWNMKEAFIEHGANFVRYINKYRRRDFITVTKTPLVPASLAVINNVVKDD